MKQTNTLRKLKELSKHYARAREIPLHQARDFVAKELGLAHWNGLTKAYEAEWSPTQDQLEKVERLLNNSLPLAEDAGSDHPSYLEASIFNMGVQEGTLNGHKYQITESLGDVRMYGTGWNLHVPEAPKKAACLEIAKQIEHDEPIYETDFQHQVLEVALTRSQQIRAGIASDWPRRSTKPDKDGRVRHPITKANSDIWYCYHCDASISGGQIAKNLWHCPSCNASPLDIHQTASWLDKGDIPHKPISDSDIQGRPDLMVEIVDTRLKLDLDAEKITLLIRSALVEDAANASERLGALFAEIDVDEDNDVWINFHECLWPEHKEPESALAVAELLGIEVEQSSCLRELPFAWPGLGEHTCSTIEYTKMMLDAYAEQRSDKSTE